MINLKDRLIRLGSSNPELRKHIRPVLDRLKQAGPEEGALEDLKRGILKGVARNYRIEKDFDPRDGKAFFKMKNLSYEDANQIFDQFQDEVRVTRSTIDGKGEEHGGPDKDTYVSVEGKHSVMGKVSLMFDALSSLEIVVDM